MLSGRWRDVFPAYAGVSLGVQQIVANNLCLPRLRGGEPMSVIETEIAPGSSPPTRG